MLEDCFLARDELRNIYRLDVEITFGALEGISALAVRTPNDWLIVYVAEWLEILRKLPTDKSQLLVMSSFMGRNYG